MYCLLLIVSKVQSKHDNYLDQCCMDIGQCDGSQELQVSYLCVHVQYRCCTCTVQVPYMYLCGTYQQTRPKGQQQRCWNRGWHRPERPPTAWTWKPSAIWRTDREQTRQLTSAASCITEVRTAVSAESLYGITYLLGEINGSIKRAHRKISAYRKVAINVHCRLMVAGKGCYSRSVAAGKAATLGLWLLARLLL